MLFLNLCCGKFCFCFLLVGYVQSISFSIYLGWHMPVNIFSYFVLMHVLFMEHLESWKQSILLSGSIDSDLCFMSKLLLYYFSSLWNFLALVNKCGKKRMIQLVYKIYDHLCYVLRIGPCIVELTPKNDFLKEYLNHFNYKCSRLLQTHFILSW